jgi:hypothetical protein
MMLCCDVQAKKTKTTAGKATIKMETDRSMFGRGLGTEQTHLYLTLKLLFRR